MHKSFATIDSPEFINLQPIDINPLMSKCEIKVFYLGENRNGTYINKETATEMAKTLRGAPIVGYFKEDKQDFADHGDVMIWDDEGVHFECRTRPYGFVAPDAQVWFQKFNDIDDFGATIEREYLMTTGFLWTGQYEEAKLAVEGEGKPHSMELDGETMKGHWSTNQAGMDFFIITDATFSKLCILGDDVEPCFEGSKVSAQEISKTFTKVDDNFKKTLFSMMQELKAALEGGQQMSQQQELPVDEAAAQAATDPAGEPAPATELDNSTYTNDDGAAATQEAEPAPAADPEPEQTPAQDFTEEPVPTTDPAPAENFEEKYNKAQIELDEVTSKFEEVKNQFEEATKQIEQLTSQLNELKAYKAAIEDAEKDKMIDSFYMLSDEDKKEVIENKANYTVDEIEAKLSIICVRKKVNFDLENTNENHNIVEDNKHPITTFNIDDPVSSTPAWVQAVLNTQSSRNN